MPYTATFTGNYSYTVYIYSYWTFILFQHSFPLLFILNQTYFLPLLFSLAPYCPPNIYFCIAISIPTL